MCGGWNVTDDARSFPVCNLPEEVASAFSQAMAGMVGANYEPLMYLATQVVSGINHMILCRERLSDEDGTVKISQVVIYVPVNGEPCTALINPLF